jgi:hypothetical protein
VSVACAATPPLKAGTDLCRSLFSRATMPSEVANYVLNNHQGTMTLAQVVVNAMPASGIQPISAFSR